MRLNINSAFYESSLLISCKSMIDFNVTTTELLGFSEVDNSIFCPAEFKSIVSFKPVTLVE